MRWLLAIVLVGSTASRAHEVFADEATAPRAPNAIGFAGVELATAHGAVPIGSAVETIAERIESAEPTRTLIYVEALGKGGAYGIGLERPITRRLSLGGVASWITVRGQQISTVSPYLHATLTRRGRHALFGELGAVLAHSKIVSPVDGWSGMSDTGGGGIAGLGYERDGKRLVFRAQGSVLAGEGGVAPWAGLAIGVKPGAFR
jgi:hypothetical protein